MKRTILVITLLLIANYQQTQQAEAGEHEIVRYTGIKTFDGSQFISKDLCVANAKFVKCTKTKGKQTVVDLKGLYVTPPFGDAHTHHFDGPYTLEWHNSIALESGAFYAMTMTAPTKGVLSIRDKLATQPYVDVASSLGGITGPESHPAEVYEALALNIRTPEERSKRFNEVKASKRYADNAYYVVDNEQSVEDKMALLLKSKPDHVKVFLRSSDRYAENWGKWGPGGGVDPKLLPLISVITKYAGLRLAVANSNIADFRESLKVEADIVTHLPCYQDTESEPDSEYYKKQTKENCLLSGDDARKAAEIGMASTLITTEWEKDRPTKLVEWEKHNINKLEKAGATLVIASNNYGATLTKGLIAAINKEFFTETQLLKIATINTPKTIFPKRKIGCLDVDCEASFIGFADNPLENFSTISKIEYRLKDGKALNTSKKK